MPPAWQAALAERGVLPKVARLAERVQQAKAAGEAVAPGDGRIFRALELAAPAEVRAVILGQDPYPTPGHADGLAFSVRRGVAPPRSLRNILRELESDLGHPAPASGSLEAWARQGVLLLNRVLTVREGAANAHARWGWDAVTDAILDTVAEGPPVAFLLWGRDSAARGARIDPARHVVLTAAHPSPLSAHRGFIGCRHFSLANAGLVARGRPAINWRLN